MLSAGLLTLQGVTLQRGRHHISAGKFVGINAVENVEDGTINVTWRDDSVETITMTSGWTNPIDCKSVEVLTGVWNLAKV